MKNLSTEQVLVWVVSLGISFALGYYWATISVTV